MAFAGAFPASAAGGAVPTAEPPRAAKEMVLPDAYGRIVYRTNPEAERQIYIIGQSHPSAITGRALLNNARIQAEIFHIGEWLNRQQQMTLLLPEGFFSRTADGICPPVTATEGNAPPLDTQSLQAWLANHQRINANRLLATHCPIRLGQIEDEQLYDEVLTLLKQARQEESLSLLAELNKRQEERTAVMLQKIPEVVETAFRKGDIPSRRAMFTIGLAHIRSIITSLQHNALRSVATGNAASLNLLDEGYGVTVILPRTVAENKRLLRLARLNLE